MTTSTSEEVEADNSQLYGHNRLSTQALTSLAQRITAEHFAVPADAVKITFGDKDGSLEISVVAPMAMPALRTILEKPNVIDQYGGSIWQRTLDAKTGIVQEFAQLSGMQVAQVNIRVMGERNVMESQGQ